MAHSEDRWVTARKPHRCMWCSECIEKGERHVVQHCAEGNMHWRNRYHAECHRAMANALQVDYAILDWWNDEACVPDFERGHIHEVGSDTREAEARNGCRACAEILKNNPVYESLLGA